MRSTLVERLGLACASGEARPGLNPDIAADLLAGMIFSGIIRKARPPRRRGYGASEYREACVDVFLGGIAGRSARR
jgi:hypothetical protein